MYWKTYKKCKIYNYESGREEICSGKDNPGLLAVSGSMNMKEYLKAPELTRQL